RYAAAKGVSVSTNTNLTALSPRHAAECVASGLRDLYVSLDAADPAAYEYIRVGARFDRVVRNLGLLQQAKRDAGAPLPEIHLVAVAIRRNLEELPRLVRFAHAHGIRAVWVQQLCHDFSEGTLPEK